MRRQEAGFPYTFAPVVLNYEVFWSTVSPRNGTFRPVYQAEGSTPKQDAHWLIQSPPESDAVGCRKQVDCAMTKEAINLSTHLENSFCLLIGQGELISICYLFQKFRASYQSHLHSGRCQMRQLS